MSTTGDSTTPDPGPRRHSRRRSLLAGPDAALRRPGAGRAATVRPVDWRPGDLNLDLTRIPVEPALAPIVDACARYDCYVATSCTERHPALPGRTFHSGFVLGPTGLELRQPKVQASTAAGVTLLREIRGEYAATLGEDAVHQVVDTPIGRLGCIVAAEQLVPETVRALAKRGAEVIVHPDGEFYPWEIPYAMLKQTLAFQNGVYFVSADFPTERWEQDGQTVVRLGCGESLIAGPTGRLLATCDHQGEGFAVAEIDFAAIQTARAKQSPLTAPAWQLFSTTYV